MIHVKTLCHSVPFSNPPSQEHKSNLLFSTQVLWRADSAMVRQRRDTVGEDVYDVSDADMMYCLSLFSSPHDFVNRPSLSFANPSVSGPT